MKFYYKLLISLLCFIPELDAVPLTQPIESFYTVKAYDSPHFHVESLHLDQNAFVELINEVNAKTHDRAFLIEVPNELYSQNVQKLRSAEFFHYYDYPEKNSSVWCRTNRSGIPLVTSHTLGARSIVYYKNNDQYFFLLVKDKYNYNHYEFPGGYVQPDDSSISQAFEKGDYSITNLDYRSPSETGIIEVYEETGFDLHKYGYGQNGTKEPSIIAQIYTKNTRPSLGIRSPNDCCQYLLFEVLPNNDPLEKSDHEILDVRWASFTDIMSDNIPSPFDTHSVTDNAKTLIERVVAMDQYKEARIQLSNINKNLEAFLCSMTSESNALLPLIQKQLALLKKITHFEQILQQSSTHTNNVHSTYFTPL